MKNSWKKDFPILKRKINGKELVYLDNAATSQVPQVVLNAVMDFEVNHRANVHRGIHTLSEESTKMYEESRITVANFIHAVVPEEIIFVKNTTEAINTVAFSWVKHNLHKGDIILVSEAEHHSNNTPWLVIKDEIGIDLKYIPLDKNGKIDIKKIDVDWGKVKFISIAHVSNVLGSINDVKEIRKYIKRRITEINPDYEMPKISVDGAQSTPHMPINVQKLGCDFFTFSGHKMCGPMGIGVLWINRDLFSTLRPFLTGGGMIDSVGYETFVGAKMPDMLEGGTPNVSGAIGLSAAIKYLEEIGMENVQKHDFELIQYALNKLSSYEGVEIYGSLNPTDRLGLISFNIKGIDSHDLAKVLDVQGIAIRSGHHCNMPWHNNNNIKSSARISFYLYNTSEDIDRLVEGFDFAKGILSGR